jgi:hypothetical protein
MPRPPPQSDGRCRVLSTGWRAWSRSETGGCVRLTTVPPAGELAPRAEDVRRAYKEPQGIEPTVAFVKAPRIVNRLFLQKPERIEAVGLG